MSETEIPETDVNLPPPVAGAIRLKLVMNSRQPRLDAHLLEAMRLQEQDDALKRISRTQFKKLFDEKKILIKGQPAKPSSSLNAGTTWVDVLFTATTPEL
jgi:23S rRNA-/tRNA-specific pseudouridylate synthase